MNCFGHIVAVRFQQYVESDYSVHVKFKDIVDTGTIKQVVHMHKDNS